MKEQLKKEDVDIDIRHSDKGDQIHVNEAVVRIRRAGYPDHDVTVTHILIGIIFEQQVARFDQAYPNLIPGPDTKNKLIKFINNRFKTRVVFKSQAQFAHYLNQRTEAQVINAGREATKHLK